MKRFNRGVELISDSKPRGTVVVADDVTDDQVTEIRERTGRIVVRESEDVDFDG